MSVLPLALRLKQLEDRITALEARDLDQQQQIRNLVSYSEVLTQELHDEKQERQAAVVREMRARHFQNYRQTLDGWMVG